LRLRANHSTVDGTFYRLDNTPVRRNRQIMTLTPQWLDELRARISLSGVISRTTRLTKAGHEFKACCPFHNEKSPSFTVNDSKGFYHCFGCGAHGDAIRWMTDQRGLSFMDAVKELAAEAGMEVPAPDPAAAKRAEQQSGLHEVTEAAQAFYRAQLDTPEGAKARAYLESRRFDSHTMERFGFGFAPAGRQALKAALKQFDEPMLIEAGMRIAVDEKEPYDRFRDRLTMPIHDARGRVIGFAARILDADKKDAPKYLNSPDTPLFDKGRTLFNLHRAGPASRQSGRIVVVEGQMDVIALAAAGIEEAVAPMGTALTERQLEMLWRMVETPILCFDGDAAGQRAAMRAITRALPMLRPSHSLKIVRMPAGMDPDDLIKRDGVAALEALLAQPRSLLDQLWEQERDAVPLASPEDKAGLKARLMAHVDTIADRDIQSLYRRELSDRFSGFAYPKREEREWRPGGSRPVPTRRSDPQMTARLRKHSGSRDALSAAVLAGLMRYPQELIRHGDALTHANMPDPRFEALVDALDASPTLETAQLATILATRGLAAPDPKEYASLRFGFLADEADAVLASESLAQAVGLLVERPALESALAEATARFERDMSEGAYAEQQRLLKRKLEFDARLRQMASARIAAPAGAATNKMAE
jgi:DNA primase